LSDSSLTEKRPVHREGALDDALLIKVDMGSLGPRCAETTAQESIIDESPNGLCELCALAGFIEQSVVLVANDLATTTNVGGDNREPHRARFHRRTRETLAVRRQDEEVEHLQQHVHIVARAEEVNSER